VKDRLRPMGPLVTMLTLVVVAACSGGLEPSERTATAQSALVEIIVDNADPGGAVVSGSFSNATAATEHYGPMSLYATTGGTIDTFRFTPTLPSADTYSVYAWNSCYIDRATDVPHRIYDGVSQTFVVDVDQDCDTGSHGEWWHLGDFALSPGAYVEITDDGIESSSPYFGADAVRFVSGDAGAGGAGGMASGSGGAGGQGEGGSTSSAGGASSGGSTGSGGAGGAPPAGFVFDPFNGATLQDWTLLNTSMFSYEVATGQLRVSVASSCASYPFCAWFENTQGPAVVREVTGDFTATTLVRPRAATALDDPPSGGYQLAGLLARDPSASSENYVLTVAGYRETALSQETKSTVDSSSTMTGPPLGDQSTADLELRLCRVGQVFHAFRRDVGALAWTHAHTYDRASAPMAATLQVGLAAYTYSTPSDLRAGFDYVSVSAGGCAP
jgi:hypothetical protein